MKSKIPEFRVNIRIQIEQETNLTADKIFYEQEMDKPNQLASTNASGGPTSVPLGTSSRADLVPKEKVHGKDALKKIKDFNPALYEILSRAYIPEK